MTPPPRRTALMQSLSAAMLPDLQMHNVGQLVLQLRSASMPTASTQTSAPRPSVMSRMAWTAIALRRVDRF